MTPIFKPVYWRSFLIISLVTITLFLGVNTTSAQDIFVGSTINSGTTINNEAVLIDDSVVVDGIVNGDVLAVGSNISINGSINGSLIALGDTININGDIGGTVYTASLSLQMEDSASLERNLYYVGLSLTTIKGSSIGRDLFTATLGATLEGNVERDISAIIGPVEFIKLIISLIEDQSGQSSTPSSSSYSIPYLPISNPAVINVNQYYRITSLASILPIRVLSHQNNISSALQTSNTSSAIDIERLKDWGITRLREFLTLFIFGLLAAWVFPSLFTGGIETVKSKPLPAFGWGMLFLVITFNIIALSFLLAGLVFIVGLWLGSVTLWSLAFIFWLLGMSGLTLTTTLFVLFVIYVSKAVVAYISATLILNQYFPKSTRYKAFPLFLGLIAFVLLHSISLIGSVISVLITGFGLGIIWLTWRNSNFQLQDDNEFVYSEIEDKEVTET